MPSAADPRMVRIMGVPVVALNMQETVDLIMHRIEQGKATSHSVLNALKIVEMEQNPLLAAYVRECDLVNADGQFVVLLSRFLGYPLPGRVTGCDLMQELVLVAHRRGLRIFLLGGSPEVVTAVVQKYRRLYSPDLIAGYHDGYFSPEEEPAIVEQICQSGADLLFVALGSPKQEIFLRTYRDTLLRHVRFMTGVGGTFDIVAGRISRAPFLLRKLGLEWLYRILREPWRIWQKKLYRLPLLFFYIVRKHRQEQKQSS